MDEIYALLKANGIVKNQYEFSERILEMDRSYYSMLKATGRKAGTLAMIRLANKLADLAHGLKHTNAYVTNQNIRRVVGTFELERLIVLGELAKR